MKKYYNLLRNCLMVFLLWAMGTNTSFAQMQGEGFIKQQFMAYTDRAVQEKIYLHTDRSLYLPGEMIWFKAYVVEGRSMQKMNLSKIAYLEIFDKDNNPVVQTKFILNGGKGNGSLILPVSIVSGSYKLRCYTNWMKNSDPDFYYETPLKIINPFIAFYPSQEEDNEAEYDVQFFPEGGQLLEGIEGKVAFRAVGKDGKGIAFSGRIINPQGETVTEFSPARFGIGSFKLKPEKGILYQAVITDQKGKVYRYALPQTVAEGYSMQIKDTSGSRIVLDIHSKNMPLEGLWLVSHTRQQNLHLEKVVFSGSKATVSVDKSKLGAGISHFTLMNNNSQPFCERLYFKYPDQNLNLIITSGKPVFNKRDKIVLDVSAEVAGKGVQNADMSVSVFLEDDIAGFEQTGISGYLWLASDLKGTVESPETYFDRNNHNAVQEMDQLMLTHGWRRFRWEDVQRGQFDYQHLPEFHGHFIYSRVTDKINGKPATDTDVFLASPDFPVRLYMGRTNKQGIAQFEVKEFYGAKELTLQTDLSEDSTKQFEVLNPFSQQFATRAFIPFVFDKSKGESLLNRSVNMQTVNAFLPKSVVAGKITLSDTMAFFGKPDERYFLDDYTRFPTMEEVLREYVRGVFVRKRQKSFQLRMIDKLIPNMYYNTNPLVLLDGIPIFDMDKLMMFDALKVKKIELLSGRYNLGFYSSTGIVSFTTYHNDLAGYELDPHVHVQSYEGIQPIREFYSPKYDLPSALNSRVPDFRNLLYWAPEVITDKNGKTQLHFYSSDQTGKYKVILQGMSPEGKTGSGIYSFEVKEEHL